MNLRNSRLCVCIFFQFIQSNSKNIVHLVHLIHQKKKNRVITRKSKRKKGGRQKISSSTLSTGYPPCPPCPPCPPVIHRIKMASLGLRNRRRYLLSLCVLNRIIYAVVNPFLVSIASCEILLPNLSAVGFNS